MATCTYCGADEVERFGHFTYCRDPKVCDECKSLDVAVYGHAPDCSNKKTREAVRTPSLAQSKVVSAVVREDARAERTDADTAQVMDAFVDVTGTIFDAFVRMQTAPKRTMLLTLLEQYCARIRRDAGL